jgi:hypothetical protein
MGEESASRWDGGRRKKHIEFPSPCFWLLLAPFEVRIWFRSNLEIQRIFNSGKEARSKRLQVALQRLVKKEKKNSRGREGIGKRDGGGGGGPLVRATGAKKTSIALFVRLLLAARCLLRFVHAASCLLRFVLASCCLLLGNCSWLTLTFHALTIACLFQLQKN